MFFLGSPASRASPGSLGAPPPARTVLPRVWCVAGKRDLRFRCCVPSQRAAAFNYMRYDAEFLRDGNTFLDSDERAYLREHLASQTLSFSLRESFRICVRALWQQAYRFKERPRSRVVVCLHAMSGAFTTAMAWVKMAWALHQAGFHVVLVDLPGFGTSEVGGEKRCSADRWKIWDTRLLANILQKLSIKRCHILAMGEACHFLFRALEQVPQLLEGEHFLYNPLLDPAELFARVYPQFDHHGHHWRLCEFQKQEALVAMLRRVGQLWAVFDGAQGEQAQLQATAHALASAAMDQEICERRLLTLTEITRRDARAVAFGQASPVRFLLLSAELRQAVVGFLAGGAPLFEPQPPDDDLPKAAAPRRESWRRYVPARGSSMGVLGSTPASLLDCGGRLTACAMELPGLPRRSSSMGALGSTPASLLDYDGGRSASVLAARSTRKSAKGLPPALHARDERQSVLKWQRTHRAGGGLTGAPALPDEPLRRGSSWALTERSSVIDECPAQRLPQRAGVSAWGRWQNLGDETTA